MLSHSFPLLLTFFLLFYNLGIHSVFGNGICYREKAECMKYCNKTDHSCKTASQDECKDKKKGPTKSALSTTPSLTLPPPPPLNPDHVLIIESVGQKKASKDLILLKAVVEDGVTKNEESVTRDAESVTQDEESVTKDEESVTAQDRKLYICKPTLPFPIWVIVVVIIIILVGIALTIFIICCIRRRRRKKKDAKHQKKDTEQQKKGFILFRPFRKKEKKQAKVDEDFGRSDAPAMRKAHPGDPTDKKKKGFSLFRKKEDKKDTKQQPKKGFSLFRKKEDKKGGEQPKKKGFARFNLFRKKEDKKNAKMDKDMGRTDAPAVRKGHPASPKQSPQQKPRRFD